MNATSEEAEPAPCSARITAPSSTGSNGWRSFSSGPLTIALFGYLRPDSFLTWSNFATILGSQSVIVVTALGLIIPLTAGDYDLSIASNLTFAGTLLAVLNVNHGLPIGVAIARGACSGPGDWPGQRLLCALFPDELAHRDDGRRHICRMD